MGPAVHLPDARSPSRDPEAVALEQSGCDIHRRADLLLLNVGRVPVITAIDNLLYSSLLFGAGAAAAPILAAAVKQTRPSPLPVRSLLLDGVRAVLRWSR